MGYRQYETLLVEARENGIVVLTLNRPNKLNAMTDTMMRDIPAACADASSDPTARVLIVTGAGRAFSAGADREDVARRQKADQPWTIPHQVGKEADLMRTCELPAIAVIRGVCAGAGMGMALACDFRVMEENSFFFEAHLAAGLTPTYASWLLPRLVGLARATDIILSQRRLYAKEALAIGLANRVVPENEGMMAALEIAQELLKLPPLTLKMAKRALWVAQDSEKLQQVREFGGMANRMGRQGKVALEDAARPEG